jgi:2-polyprenyl-6-methoxyphenol hydroxylase-like FAD-dependent oxidoreductase
MGLAGRCPPRDSSGTHESSVWVEALRDGWWYSAPLPDGALMAVWLTDAEELRGRDPARAWLTALTSASHTRVRVLAHAPPQRIHVRSARSACLDRAAGPGWLAVGDAALCRDPLSSSGLALALAGGEQAALAVDAHARGHASALPEHDAAVQRELARYLATRAGYYRLETRWPDAPFWARRQRSEPTAELLATAPA